MNCHPLTFSLLTLALWVAQLGQAAAQLPSWREPYKSKIIGHIELVTAPDSPDYIPYNDRIAAFDLDGTLISERPDYFHGFISKRYLLDRIKEDPSLLEQTVYKKVHERDARWLRRNLKPWIVESFSGVPLEKVWHYSQRIFATLPPDPKGPTYDKMWYLPMVELVDYLHQKRFQVYIVSTAQQEIIRATLHKWLKIDPSRVIGSMVALKTGRRGKSISAIRRVNDAWIPFCHGTGKVLRFRERVGKPPVFGAGNSTNDIALLTYATTSPYKSMNLVLDHDDPREYEYTKQRLLDTAKKEKWLVVSMRRAFKRVYGDISFIVPASQYLLSGSGGSSSPSRALLFTLGVLGILILLIGAVLLIKLRVK